jgi:hypothetical protein
MRSATQVQKTLFAVRKSLACSACKLNIRDLTGAEPDGSGGFLCEACRSAVRPTFWTEILTKPGTQTVLDRYRNQ